MAGVQADLDRWNNGNDADYITTVRVNLVKISWDVLIENPATNNHAARATFAAKVINHTNEIATKLAIILAAKDVAAANILTSITNQWDNITGLL